jgi:hypothetical protein
VMDDFFDMEIILHPYFWITILVSGGILWYILNSWVGKVDGILKYALFGGIGIVIFAYFWTAKKINE